MIIVYKTDGTVEQHDIKKPGLEWFQAAVGGYIEVVPAALWSSGGGRKLVVNEDGLTMGLPKNKRATVELGFVDGMLVGDVVVCERFDLT